jgi:hypothetical protein
MSDCCASLGTIEKQCGGANASGLKTKLYVACKEDIDVIPAVNTDDQAGDLHTILTDITMKVDKVFYEFNISKTGSTFVCEPEGEAEFITYNITLTVLIPKLNPAASAVLNGIIGGEYVIIFETRNDQKMILGDLDEACTIAPRPAIEDQNAYTLTININSNNIPYFYAGVVPV